VTGSNASILSSELSTFLTGRHKTIRIYPFSFREYLRYYSIVCENPEYITSTQKGEIIHYLRKYLEEGGFPAVIRSGDITLSEQYLTDIIYRDIVSRFGIREIKELKDLTVYLISNTGKLMSYKTLAEITGLKSVSTIKNYLDYLEQAFLLYRLAPLHYSLKTTSRASYKIYAGDLSFIQSAGFHLTEDLGPRIENLVFLELLRRHHEVYYYSGSGECDFLVKRNQVIEEAIQVSYSLIDQKTLDREIKGLSEAMEKFNVKKGLILTFDDEELFNIPNNGISVVPIWKWLLTSS
jgi:predicted AAA+ superfamily ATPase